MELFDNQNVPASGSLKIVVDCDGAKLATAFLSGAATVKLSLHASYDQAGNIMSKALAAGTEAADSTAQANVSGLKWLVLVLENSDAVDAAVTDVHLFLSR